MEAFQFSPTSAGPQEVLLKMNSCCERSPNNYLRAILSRVPFIKHGPHVFPSLHLSVLVGWFVLLPPYREIKIFLSLHAKKIAKRKLNT